LGSPNLFSKIDNLTIGLWILPKQIQEDVGALGWEGTEYGPWQITIKRQNVLFQVNVSGETYKIITRMLSQESEWSYLTFVYDGKNLISYLNGVRKGVKNVATGSLQKAKGEFLEIGRYSKESWIVGGQVLRTHSFNGLIDEVRISDKARDSGWIKTSFENQNDPSSFIKTSQQELY